MSAVIWTEEALDNLSDIYVQATLEQRDVLVERVDFINQRLQENAMFEGESRSGPNRVAFFPPMCVLYSAKPHRPIFIVRVRPMRFWK